MKHIIQKLRSRHKYASISDATLSLIILRCVDSIKRCYRSDLEKIKDKNTYDAKLSEFIHTHCYNQTHTTKTQVKRILQNSLSQEIYAKFGVKLLYDILNTGELLTQENSILIIESDQMLDNIHPKLEIICSKILVRLDERVKNRTDKKDHSMIDPITILIILSVILTFIRILQECDMWNKINPKTKDQRASIMQSKIRSFSMKRSWLNKLRMNRVMKKYLTKQQYDFYGDDLRESIMDVGEKATEDETMILMEAANV